MSPPDRIARFSGPSRFAHWANAVGVIVLIATGAVLWGAPGTQWVGNRGLVRDVHLWVGLGVLVPLLATWIVSRSTRDDFRRLARWSLDDRRWWFRSQRRTTRLGKFNPGQKANAAFTLAALFALLVTGIMLKWPDAYSDDIRAGATAVHDWTALVLGLAVIGHIVMAVRDPVALRGMVNGQVDRQWAASRAPRWYAEVVAAHPHGSERPTVPETDPQPAEVAR